MARNKIKYIWFSYFTSYMKAKIISHTGILLGKLEIPQNKVKYFKVITVVEIRCILWFEEL